MNQLNSLLLRLETRLGPIGAAVFVALAITLFSFFFGYPIQIFHAAFGHPRLIWSTDRFIHSYMPLSQHPFSTRESPAPDPYWLSTRQRILGPLIAWTLGLRGGPSALIPLLANPCIYVVTYRLLRGKTAPCTAFVATIVLSLTLICITSQVWPGYQDSLAALFLLLSLIVVSPVWSAVILGIGMFADERILGAAILVLIWQVWVNLDHPRDWFARSSIRCFWLGVVALLWFAYFWSLLQYLGTDITAVKTAAYSNVLKYVYNIWPGWYQGLRGAWILPIALAAFWLKTGDYRRTVIFCLGIIPVLGMALCVQDISRTTSIAFPAFLMAVILLYRYRPLFTNHLLIAALIIQMFSPIGMIIADWGTILQPYPLVPLNALARHFK